MALTQLAGMGGDSCSLQLYGDGVATSITVDISRLLQLSPVYPEVASTLLGVSGTHVSGGVLSGNYLTVNFSVAPSGVTTVDFYIGV
jgi:hypothetical protein